ncbi:hypothetical protein FT663_01857 [Candidozyma haemuli var. vulneris]|nr:hypothetical protein FT663_01857 [[Candida] haemuloni var. vulneris]KAF3993886.1 hypothetical protein FT662_00334 [[Candida] haemuloni var. vulneris]
MSSSSDDLFLGFDLSTQQLKVIVTDADLNARKTYAVGFDDYFKDKYGVNKGVLTDENAGEILSPVKMWLEAVDTAFGLMKKDNFPFQQVKGMSGSGMQHGSVYWSSSASDALENLGNASSLLEGLDGALAWETSPNWQDHSTGQEIKDFEKVTGGPDNLAERTGSRAHHRFTGLQIRKLAVRKAPEVYQKTSRISLVSSFLASVLLGKIAPIEHADACGMNIYNIADGKYDEELTSVAAGVHPSLDGASKEDTANGVRELKDKLGPIDEITYDALGTVCPYFIKKYGFSEDAKIYSFTGDNLATIISLPVEQNDVMMSLGTSTTVLLVTEQFNPSSQYHLFKHPTIKNAYMGMICYSNGALAREYVRNDVNEKYKLGRDSWDKFDEILDASEKFDNRLGIYFPIGEIVPNAASQFKRCKLEQNGKIEEVQEWECEEDVTSIVESQTISCRLRAGPMLSGSASASTDTPDIEDKGLKGLYHKLHTDFGDIYTDGKKQTFSSLTAKPHKLFFVGGASKNTSIIRKMASIMGATAGNFQVEIPNACALGGAYKASWSYACEQSKKWIDYNEYLSKNFNFNEVDNLDVKSQWENYFPAMGLLAKMEQSLKHD